MMVTFKSQVSNNKEDVEVNYHMLKTVDKPLMFFIQLLLETSSSY